MIEQEYLTKFKDIQDSYELEMKLLRKEYALSNNPYPMSDFIKDRNQVTIRIDKIGIHYNSLWNSLPCCYYEGTKVNSDCSLRPEVKLYRMYQIDVIKHIPACNNIIELGKKKRKVQRKLTNKK